VKTLVTYNDNATEIFRDKSSLTFWDDCDRILDVKSIKEVD